MNVDTTGLAGDEHRGVDPAVGLQSRSAEMDVRDGDDRGREAGCTDDEQLDDRKDASDDDGRRSGEEHDETLTGQHVDSGVITGAPGPGRRRTPR